MSLRKEATQETPVQSMAAALVEVNEQLLVLYQLASISAGSLDEAEAAEAILNRAQSLLEADHLALTVDGTEVYSTGAPPTEVAPNRRAGDRQGRAPNRTTVEVSNGTLNAQLSGLRLKRPFGTADHKLLTAVASMALGAVQTSRHHHQALAGAVAQRDHDTASELAQLALPTWRPELSGVDVFARSDPARAAGGDLFTFAVQGDVLHFAVGDVSGKGLPAALMMTTVISAATAAFQTHGTAGPGAVLETIDRWTHHYLAEAGLFVTLMAGSYNSANGELAIASAGHGPIFFLDGDHSESIPSTVPPIGVLPLVEMGPVQDAVIHAPTGSRLVVSSDGFTEQQNREGLMWGEDRMLALLTESTLPTTQLGDLIFEQLDAHANGASQNDDRTLLIVGMNHNPSGSS